jgi:hypothetical protein
MITANEEKKRRFQMQAVEDSEITDLSDVYKDMDRDGKKTMVWMAKALLDVQLVGKCECTAPVEQGDQIGHGNR